MIASRSTQALLLLVLATLAIHALGDKRDLDIDTNQHSVRVNAFSQSAGVKTAYRFEFTTDGFPRFRQELRAKSTDTDASYRFRVGLIKVVEYNDTGSVAGQFDSGDTVTFTKRLSTFSSNSWSQLRTWITTTTNSTNGTVRVFHWNTFLQPFSGSGSALNISFRLSEQDAVDQGVAVNPKSVKFDINLEAYHFNTAADSVAIVLGATSRDSRKIQISSQTGNVPIGDQGAFSWSKTVLKGSSLGSLNPATIASSDLQTPAAGETDVGSNGGDFNDDDDPTESSNLIFFSVPSAGIANNTLYVQWDPVVALDTSSASSLVASAATLFSVLLLTFLMSGSF